MSVIATVRFQADPAKLESWASNNEATLSRIADSARDQGCMHHMFGAGNGEVVAVDEWPDEASFQKFFSSQPDIPKVMAAVGAKPDPQVTFMRKMSTPDQF
jgi:hypothetical protein